MIDPTGDGRQSPVAASDLLLGALDLLSEGLGVFDSGLKLASCNARFVELCGYPAALCRPGTPIAAFFRFHAERGDYGDDDVDVLVNGRLERVRTLSAQAFDQIRPDRNAVRIRYEPSPAGGVLVVSTKVTDAALAAEERISRLLTSSPAVL